MSRGAHGQWHESFPFEQPNRVGEARLVFSYSAIFHGFIASLTEAKLATVVQLSSFFHVIINDRRV
jgi:hypothetical protein